LNLIFFFLWFQTLGEPVMLDRVAIKVNDKIITERELSLTYLNRRKDLLARNEYSVDLAATLDGLWDELVEESVNELLLYEKSVELGWNLSHESVEGQLENQRESNGLSAEEFASLLREQTGMTLKQYIDYTLRSESANRVIQQAIFQSIQIDDPEVVMYYEQHLNEFTVPESFRVLEIVILKGKLPSVARDTAERCLKDLQEGLSFEVAIQTYSESPSKEINGDLGLLNQGDLNAVIEKAALALAVGEFSGIVETDTAYYLLKLAERHAAHPKPFDEVKEEIKYRLRSPRFEKAYERYMKELKDSYLVEVVVKERPADLP
jgi:parvulin-like peptidyl-prolyl isomerase